MKLLIVDKNKIQNLSIQDSASETFTVPFVNDKNEEVLLSIEIENGKKIIKSNGSVDVIDNQNFVESIELLPFNKYTIKIIGIEDLVQIFTFDTFDNTLYKLNFNDLTKISIGSNNNNNVSFISPDMLDVHAVLEKSAAGWKIIANGKIYINNTSASEKILEVGDIIFIEGLKVVWMNLFIMITSFNNKQLSINGLTTALNIDLSREYEDIEDDINLSLFSENDFFYHTPKLTERIEKEKISVDVPPTSPLGEELPVLLSMGSSITMLASSFIMGYNVYTGLKNGSSVSSLMTSIIMCVAMLIGSVIMPKILVAYKKRQNKKKEKLRQEKYTEYLQNKERNLTNILNAQRLILYKNHFSANECEKIITTKNQFFWSRENYEEDFLTVRLGIGNIDAEVIIEISEPKFSLDKDNLLDDMYAIKNKYKYLNKVPIVYNFVNNKTTAFISNFNKESDYIEGLFLQLLTAHSPLDLKIVVFTNYENKNKWEFLKMTPHIFSEDKSVRFFASTESETTEVVEFLENEIKERKSQISESVESEDKEMLDGFKKFNPYYLIITDSYNSIKYSSLVTSLIKTNTNYGLSLMIFDKTMKNIPSECNAFIEVSEKEGGIFNKNLNSDMHRVFIPEIYEDLNLRKCTTELMNIPTVTKDGLKVLPSFLTFLDMYKVSKIEHLNIYSKWQENNPEKNLGALIGVHTSGEGFKLNLHEKAHGPHGLIAGSTGSGKSEFIITYILSMAINYHPYEVQFVLIDYKGGGLAGAFENKESGIRLPHLVGTITNLDVSEMNRTLVSINSEVKRRQIIFNEVREALGESTIHIYKYQKLYREGSVKEPMSHLFIVCDEFAELKSQQPEFMNDLISIARIGRSLGIHLILATQKPSGVVNDQIWSNSKFKVCLKVQSKSDSMEMLKRPEAASLKEAGRFYLQIGYDEYFDIGQSGWAGAKYVPTDRIVKKVDTAVSYLDNTGSTYKVIKEVDTKVNVETVDLGDQLTNIVKFISDIGAKENLVINDLWLPKIPEDIYLEQIKAKYSYKPAPYFINPVIGEYDSPSEQSQNILSLDLTNNGNTLISGLNGSGKDYLLSTIIWSSIVEHTPDEVNIYVIDCGSETLKKYYNFPHIGEILGVSDSEKINGLCEFLYNEIERRKKLFMDYSGSYNEYIKTSGKQLPLIITIINSYEVFTENYAKLSEKMLNLYRDGAKYGVVFIISMVTTNAIRMKNMQSFSKMIALKLANDLDYRSFLGSPKGLSPADYYARGIIKFEDDKYYEFQTANIYLKDEINNVIKNAAVTLNNSYITRAKKVVVIPEVVDTKLLEENEAAINSLPIGYNILSKDVYNINLENLKFLQITALRIDQIKLNFMYYLIKATKKISNDITLIDGVNVVNVETENINLINSDFDKSLAELYNNIISEQLEDSHKFIFVLSLDSLLQKLSIKDQFMPTFFEKIKELNTVHLIFIDDFNSINEMAKEEWFTNNITKDVGIWLGDGVKKQSVIKFNDLSKEEAELMYQSTAFVNIDSNHTIIKHAMEEFLND